MTRQATAAQALRIKLISAAVASCFAAGAQANPTGGLPVTGVDSIATLPGGVLQVITNAPKSIINWQSFSIDPGEITRFMQPSAASAVLNRVVTTDPSNIMGTLQSNGRVFLINPNGILFGAGSVVDTAGLVASSLNLSDADFLAGNLRFQPVSGAGQVVNEGTILNLAGGPVYLVGPAVTNGGFIDNSGGEVILAAGNSVEIVNPETPGVSVAITAPDNQALNLGDIFVGSGRVGIFAGLIDQRGSIAATSALPGVDGSIRLVATDTVVLGTGSNTVGGPLDIETGNLVVAGVASSGQQTIHATGGVLVQNGSLHGSNGQTIEAQYVEVEASAGGLAIISHLVGEQRITTTGTNAAGEGLAVRNASGSVATIQNNAGGQVIDVAGALTVQAGPTGNAFISAFGDQAISAGSILLQGGSGGSGRSAQIVASNGSQSVNAGPGGITLIGGSSTGTNNFAQISQATLDPAFTQTVNSAGPVLLDSGDAGAFNFTIIRAFGGHQSLDAGSTTLMAGAGGAANFAAIQAQSQDIHIRGDLAMVGGGSTSSGTSGGGAQMGGRGGAALSATNLALAVDGNLTLSGGTVSGSVIGQGLVNNEPTNAAIEVGGNVALNPGTAPGATARIGARLDSSAGGDISITAGGSIALNSNSPNNYSLIRTADDVTLTAQQVTQGADAKIQANTLSTETQQGASLIGANSVNTFSAFNTSFGDVAFNNSSALLTLPAVQNFGGAFSLQQAGDALVTGGVFSGTQTIDVSGALTVQAGAFGAAQLNAFGDQTVSADSILLHGGSSGNGNSASIVANFGSQTVNAGAGGITLIGGSSTGTNNVAQISQATLDPAFTQTVHSDGSVLLDSGDAGAFNFTIIRGFGGHQSVTAGSTTLMAGAGGAANFAAIQAQSQDINIQGNLAMAGGGSTSSGTSGGGAQMGGRGGGLLSATNLSLTVSGDLTMTGGTVAGAVIGQGLVNNEPTNIAIGAGGNVALNPGTAPGATARIGARLDSSAGGDISITAGGGIALNSTSPGNYSLIRTADGVTLTAQQITQGPDAKIQANTLTVNTQQGASLIGANSVNTFSAFNALFGDVALNNSSALLTLPAVQNFGGGFVLQQSGDALVSGGVFSGPQTVNVIGGLTVRAEPGSFATLGASGGQAVNASQIVLDGSNGQAMIYDSGGSQTVNAGSILLRGGSTGSGRSALIIGSSSSQQVDAGSITLVGGAGGSGNIAHINSINGSQVVNAGSGSILLQGGASGSGNSALLGASFAQQVNAGRITLIGGADGASNFAHVNVFNGAQTVNAGGISLTGGSGGVNNTALLRAGGLQTIAADEITVNAGAGGTGNFAIVVSPQQDIMVSGDVTLNGGGSAPTPVAGAAALIGGGNTLPTNLSLTVGGNVTLNGGHVVNSGASLGNGLTGLQPTDITLNVGGNVTLNPGTATGARIGSGLANPLGGDIVVNAGGTIALNSAGPGLAGAIRTADGVILRAQSITQGADAVIQANTLTLETQQGASLVGANSVNTFSASNALFGDVALNNSSALLALPAVQNPFGAFLLNQSGDLLVTGFVNSGPQAVSATGTLTVRGDAFSSGQLSAFGGQTISAHAIDVVAQDGGSASIMNSGSGDQSILVAGGGTSAGLDVRTLSGGGVASIQNLAPGATQTVSVTDADHISVQAVGTTAANINAIGGTQLISIAGSGANAVNLGTAGAQGASQLVASNQSLVAGAAGEAGSITIVGSDGNQRLAGLVSQPGVGNSQTVSTSGALTIIGGSAPAQLTNFPAGLFHNGTGQQTISAQSIVLQGGGTGVNNSAQIGANNGTQLVNAGSITLVGGPDGTGNSAQIRANQGLQTIVAGELSLTAGAGGTNNFAAITGPTQDIAVAGDLTITGGGSLGTPGVGGGARIGGRGGAAATPTVLALSVGGDVTMNGGTVSGAAIGSSPDGGQPTQITMNVGGDVTLNAGAVAGTRIGSGPNNVAGGEIVVNAGGTIALNSAGPGNAGAIRTTDGATLNAQSITQGPDAVIQANTLTIETQQGASLIGANAVNSLSAVNTTSGDFAFDNASDLLTVTGIDQIPAGALSLGQSGSLLINGDVTSGAQTINATGDITITPGDGPGVTVLANGAQSFSAGGSFSLLGGTAWNGFAQSIATGALQVSAGGNLTVQGGSGLLAYSLLYGGDEVRLTVGNELHVNGGASPFAFGRIQTGFWDTIYLSFPNRESGGYFVNGVEGARVSGLDGFFTGLRPAVLGRSLLVDYGI